MRALFAAILALGALLLARPAAARPRIVAAENMYADVARQIAGPAVDVRAIMSNPDTDPHLFEATPRVARALAHARIVVENGAGYDPWMARLIAANPAPGRVAIVIAALIGARTGANPHLWYAPATMPAFARALTAALIAQDPAHRDGYRRRDAVFLASLRPIAARIAALRARYAGTKVTATEPVFGYLARALGLDMRNHGFQRAVMNGTEPSPRDVAAMERDLDRRAVRVLIYNRQASDPAAQRLLHRARSAGVPVLGVTETEPAGTTYQSWVMGELDALAALLARTP